MTKIEFTAWATSRGYRDGMENGYHAKGYVRYIVRGASVVKETQQAGWSPWQRAWIAKLTDLSIDAEGKLHRSAASK